MERLRAATVDERLRALFDGGAALNLALRVRDRLKLQDESEIVVREVEVEVASELLELAGGVDEIAALLDEGLKRDITEAAQERDRRLEHDVGRLGVGVREVVVELLRGRDHERRTDLAAERQALRDAKVIHDRKRVVEAPIGAVVGEVQAGDVGGERRPTVLFDQEPNRHNEVRLLGGEVLVGVFNGVGDGVVEREQFRIGVAFRHLSEALGDALCVLLGLRHRRELEFVRRRVRGRRSIHVLREIRKVRTTFVTIRINIRVNRSAAHRLRALAELLGGCTVDRPQARLASCERNRKSKARQQSRAACPAQRFPSVPRRHSRDPRLRGVGAMQSTIGGV